MRAPDPSAFLPFWPRESTPDPQNARNACTLAHVGPTTHAHTHPRMNTHVFARTRANTLAHAHMCTRSHATHVRAVTCKHAPAQCTYMHTHAAHARMNPHNVHAGVRTRTHEHACTCARTRVNTRPHIFGCALTDWGHTSQ